MHRTTAGRTSFSLSQSWLLLRPILCSDCRCQSVKRVLDVTSMDTSVDPCTDFFAYSCGGWIKKNPIPPDQTSWSVYSKLEDDNKSILREILESSGLACGQARCRHPEDW